MLHSVHTPEMLAGNNGTDSTVPERQRARLKWQQQQQLQELGQSYFNDALFNPLPLPSTTQQFQDLINNETLKGRSLKVDRGGLENGWPDFGKFAANMVADYALSRTSSSPPAVDNAVAPPVTGKRGGEILSSAEKMSSNVKKRKADKTQNSKVVLAEDTRDKKIKLDAEEDFKVADQNNNRETSADSAKENSKVTEVQKPDYIHVRARRGQATDSHSLAERVRREKISERMKYLQDLVPGCNKITGKAGMLDEIINYVQSLQSQVEFLSMKLATVNPKPDFNIDNFFAKEMFPTCADNFPSEVPNCSAYLPFNPLQQVVSCCGFDMVTSPQEMALRRTISAPISVPETILDTSCFTQVQPSSSPWDTDLQSLYNVDFNQGGPTGFAPQSFTGSLEANNLKMEM